MRSTKLEWSRYFWLSLLSVSHGIKLPSVLYAGHVLHIFPEHKPFPVLTYTIEEIGTPPRSFGTFYDKFIDQYGIDKSRFSITTFVNMVIDRSKGQATVLKLPQFSTEAALRYVSDACPLLKHLTFQDNLVIFKHYQILPEVIGKWKFLESLLVGGTLMLSVAQLFNGIQYSQYFQELLTLDGGNTSCDNVLERTIVQIGIHCKQFRKLRLTLTHLRQAEALAIVNFLPQLETIWAFRCIIDRDSILTIARGSKELQVFEAVYRAGLDENDEEIYKVAGESRETGKIVCEACSLNIELLKLVVRDAPAIFRDKMTFMLRMLGQ